MLDPISGNEQVVRLESVISLDYNPDITFMSGTREMLSLDNFRLYPNPAQDVVILSAQFKAGVDYHLRFVNAHGQVVYQSGLRKSDGFILEQIDISQLVNGIYTVQMISGKERYLHTFLVQR